LKTNEFRCFDLEITFAHV